VILTDLVRAKEVEAEIEANAAEVGLAMRRGRGNGSCGERG
jgi:hypothetical protein